MARLFALVASESEALQRVVVELVRRAMPEWRILRAPDESVALDMARSTRRLVILVALPPEHPADGGPLIRGLVGQPDVAWRHVVVVLIPCPHAVEPSLRGAFARLDFVVPASPLGVAGTRALLRNAAARLGARPSPPDGRWRGEAEP